MVVGSVASGVFAVLGLLFVSSKPVTIGSVFLAASTAVEHAATGGVVPLWGF
tara:strand:- start:311 stop:466 length:156 start_codon:yes stop_codon:yes gene_type:complete